jgi:SHS2 domain-containing protein
LVYSYLDHISDVYIHIHNDTLEGVFEEAAIASFDVIIETSKVRIKTIINVELDADDLEQLLYKWIDHLLYIFDAKSFAISRTEVIVSEKKTNPSLVAKIYGESYDPKKHGQKVAVKAMTYSLMRIYKKGDHWEAYFVLDI